MKFAVLVIAAAAVGAIATVAVPSDVLDSGTSQLQAVGDRVSQIKLVDLNPLRAIYDWEMERVRKPLTPEELGFHPSTVTAEPYSFASPGYDPPSFNRRGGFGQGPVVLPSDGPH